MFYGIRQSIRNDYPRTRGLTRNFYLVCQDTQMIRHFKKSSCFLNTKVLEQLVRHGVYAGLAPVGKDSLVQFEMF